MITPRITRLLRVPDLQAMQRAIARVACGPREEPARTRARASAVIVPTRGAAEALRRTIESLRLREGPDAIILPDLITRAEFYARLHERTAGMPARLLDFEREVIFRRAALDASARGSAAPFSLRAGLIVEMLALYDELRRRDRTIDAFERLMIGSLEPSAEIDRGAARLLVLTRFLCAAFRELERRIAETGRVDEHGLRARLLDQDGSVPVYRHLIVTVPDQSADPHGLWSADYDLLARMPGIERLDIIATENMLASGFHQRVHDLLPGIEEEQMGSAATPPVLYVPETGETGRPGSDPAHGGQGIRWFTCRDREEELVDVARLARRRSRDPNTQGSGLSRLAVVLPRPLPYLYLARQVFADAQVPYQAVDSLPLAAEPFAAALDVIFSFAAAEATRASTVEMLASTHWTFTADGTRIARRDVAAADELLREVKYLGGWDRLSSLAAEAAQGPVAASGRRLISLWTRAARALRAADAAAAELRPVLSAPAASDQISALLAFIAAHEALPMASDSWYERHLRARAAILAALEWLRDAHRRYDDEPLPLAELAGVVRRWIEGQTFLPRTGSRGVILLDAPAAAYADVDEVRLVGLVESDWPERSRRSIFYPASLLTQLGWPSEAERLAAGRARFRDLLRLAKVRVSASTFTLEDDAIVAPSPLLDELDATGLAVDKNPPHAPARVFLHEALTADPVVASAIAGPAAGWLALRASRSSSGEEMFHGAAGARQPGVYAVSHIERYLECPFKYFAAYVLKLPEEREEESGLTPQERGQFLHEVFEDFFRQWQDSGGRTITTANLADAVALFERVAETRLATLAETDRALERTYVLGSAAASGLAERAFAFEVEQGGEVIERLLEHSLEGEFLFQTEGGTRAVRLRAKADRIDLLADGSLRIIDYKLGKAPKQTRALQLPVYGVCAEQHLEGRHGRSWKVGRAGYVAFKEKNSFVPLGASSSLDEAVALGQERLLGAIDAIEQGLFPPNPDEPFMCTRCAYSSVCRKDYVGDE